MRLYNTGYNTGDNSLCNPKSKEFSKLSGIRPDYVDFDNNVIYELKPNNPRSINLGIKQLHRYNEALGGGYTLVLELY